MTKYDLTVNGNNLSKIIKKRKCELDDLMNEFMLNYYKTKVDKMGNVIDDNNQYLVATFFFKSINPIPSVEPLYNSEQLGQVWNLYMYIIEQVNLKITIFPPTLNSFAKFAGISLETFKSLKQDSDESMRVLYDKIDGEIIDANLLLAQNKTYASKPTEFRLKIENEVVEKKNPNVNISVNTKTIDLDKINERLYEINHITKKQIKYEGK